MAVIMSYSTLGAANGDLHTHQSHPSTEVDEPAFRCGCTRTGRESRKAVTHVLPLHLPLQHLKSRAHDASVEICATARAAAVTFLVHADWRSGCATGGEKDVPDDGCLLPRLLCRQGLNRECRTWAVREPFCYLLWTGPVMSCRWAILPILTTSGLSVWPLQGRRSWEEVSEDTRDKGRVPCRTRITKRLNRRGKTKPHNFSQVAVCHASIPTRLASALSILTVNILVRLLWTRWRGAFDLYHGRSQHSCPSSARRFPIDTHDRATAYAFRGTQTSPLPSYR
ncbi:hypothetical protein V8C26DRAFT_396736 [Trichoderma gracile]